MDGNFDDWINAAVIFTVVTAGLGGYLVALSALSRQARKQTTRATEEIAEALKHEEAARRAAALEAVAQKFPGEPEKVREFAALLEKVLVHVSHEAARVQASPTIPGVEGLISGYHEQALSQARVQFWFSVVAATVGFAWILYTGVQIDGSPSSLAKPLPGVAIDAVAFLFFRQATETRQRATDLYDRLRKDKQMSEASSVVASIADDKVRSVAQAQIALQMAGLQQTAIDLTGVLPKNA